MKKVNMTDFGNEVVLFINAKFSIIESLNSKFFLFSVWLLQGIDWIFFIGGRIHGDDFKLIFMLNLMIDILHSFMISKGTTFLTFFCFGIPFLIFIGDSTCFGTIFDPKNHFYQKYDAINCQYKSSKDARSTWLPCIVIR